MTELSMHNRIFFHRTKFVWARARVWADTKAVVAGRTIPMVAGPTINGSYGNDTNKIITTPFVRKIFNITERNSEGN